MAQAHGLPVRLLDALFLTLQAVTVAEAAPMVFFILQLAPI